MTKQTSSLAFPQAGPIRIVPHDPQSWPYIKVQDVSVELTGQTLPVEPLGCPICDHEKGKGK